MKSIIKTDFSRAFINWKFPLAILLMFLVWDLNSKRFGLREDVLFYFINVWGRSITYLMAILISTIPFLSAHIEEKENHFLRYAILRTGVWKYVCSKLIVCFISAFSVCVLGTALFLIKQSFYVPFLAENSVTLDNFAPMSCFCGLMISHIKVAFMIQTILYGMLCGSMGVLTMAFSAYIDNSFEIYVIPFLLYYCFYFLFAGFFKYCPMLSIEHIYEAIGCYTKNPVLFFSYAFFITICFGIVGGRLMYRKMKGEFQ